MDQALFSIYLDLIKIGINIVIWLSLIWRFQNSLALNFIF